MKSTNEKTHDKNVEKVYANRASVYNKAKWTKDQKFIGKIIKFVSLRKNQLALEIGIGTGLLAREAKKKLLDIYGIDSSRAMLNQLPREIKKANVVCMKAEKMPYLDKSFDVVYWRSVIMHVLDPQSIINESFRVLKKGGQMFMVEPVELTAENRKFIFDFINLKDDTHHYYFTKDDLYKRLKVAGYKKLDYTTHIETMPFNSWIEGGAVSNKRRERLKEYLINAPEKFKKEFEIKILPKDLSFNVKWIIIKGKKI